MNIKIFSKTKEKGNKDARYKFKVTTYHINKFSEFLKENYLIFTVDKL